ncbi:MAG: 16S rRNA (cytidine(1402)-2'-O)-methyltransferase, partial [Alphaproteobacteria bacterium]|nr:16S rRNA (cytidine(1402)-2'-O)-methyltransferase [Alphaproteobacteria bacterium]
LRALRILGKADLIACEDTRVSGKLTSYYDISAPKMPYHDHNAEAARPKLLALLREGRRIALISDAGMPLVSDPGYKLVAACAAENIPVTCVPGASASLAAVVLSGLPTDKFMFVGFLPVKQAARRAALAEIKNVPATLVFYETGPRLEKSLQDMLEVLGDRQAAVARELTKKFEEVNRDNLSNLLKYYAGGGETRGEIVVVVGAPETDGGERWTEADIDALLLEMVGKQGMSVKDAAAYVSAKSGLKKRDVYQRALLLNKKGDR